MQILSKLHIIGIKSAFLSGIEACNSLQSSSHFFSKTLRVVTQSEMVKNSLRTLKQLNVTLNQKTPEDASRLFKSNHCSRWSCTSILDFLRAVQASTEIGESFPQLKKPKKRKDGFRSILQHRLSFNTKKTFFRRQWKAAFTNISSYHFQAVLCDMRITRRIWAVVGLCIMCDQRCFILKICHSTMKTRLRKFMKENLQSPRNTGSCTGKMNTLRTGHWKLLITDQNDRIAYFAACHTILFQVSAKLDPEQLFLSHILTEDNITVVHHSKFVLFVN